ncbi:S41 family peptidase [Porphyromonadaceae bacterium W3.11]|nr:S41 family peptidase [Porphyromonadaceae bacterium W3.11]
MRLNKTIIALLLLVSGVMAHANDNPLWMRYPAISPDGSEIAFTYKGDIYKVPAQGGEAVRLTTNPAHDTRPMWSPDGKKIAFESNRHYGANDIYIMDSEGGTATRVTTHSSSEKLISFSPDGQFIYYATHIQDPASSALFPTGRLNELYKVPTTGGRSIMAMATPVSMGNISKDGRYLIYEDIKGFENEWRKHHTSSVTKDIKMYDFKNKSYSTLVDWKGEDRNPVFAPDNKNFYFLSERAGTINVFKQGLNGSTATQMTSFKHHPVRFLSVANNGVLCFGYDGEIYTLRDGGTASKVNIKIINDLDETLDEQKTFTRGATSVSVSPDGSQIAFIVRGEVFVTSVEYSTTKRITETTAEESSVSFGADNRSIVYASERDGKSDLYIAKITRDEDPNFPNATLITEEKLIPNDHSEKMHPQFSPDGKEVAFVKDRSKVMIYNIERKELRQVTNGKNVTERNGYIGFVWSPDGKWMAMEMVDNHHEPFGDIMLVSTEGENNEIHNLTQSGYFAGNPRFVMDGNAIIYYSEQYGMRNHASWGSMNDVMIVFLNRESYNKFVLNAEEYELLTEAEKKAKEEEEKEKDKDEAKKETKKDSKDILVELENIEYRTLRLTPVSSQLGDAYITDDGKKLYYMSAFEGGYDLWVKDLRKHETKLLKKMNGSYQSLTPDAKGKNLFLLSGSSFQKMSLASESITPISYRATMKLNTAEEREFMFDYVKREEAARFYVKDMHGVDWEFMTQEYRKFLPHINNNHDFSEMLSELLGELNVSHTGSGYGSPRSAESTAELGLFFDLSEASDKGLKIEEVVVGGPFDTYLSKVQEGDYLTKIDGVEIKKDVDYFPLLTGKINKPVLLSFYSVHTGKSWEEVIKPISAGKLNGLLYERWIKQRADEVDRLSNGRLGYVHIPSMDDNSFRRVFSDVMGKYYQRDGIVIDIRYNGGGRLHEDLEAFFSGTKYLTQEVQGKYYCDMPSKRWTKPSVMVICEADYSNAHGTPWVFKKMGISKLVGMPVPGTMTSVNWVTLQDPSLYFGIPAVGYKTDEGYYLENFQLEPDVKVELDLKKVLKGEDTQMEAAVRELM